MPAELTQVDAYLRVMEDIKRRIQVAGAFLDGSANAIYKPTQMECAVLQMRMVAELVALASLAANAELFSEHGKKFSRHWNLKDILKDIERINPGYYPRPFRSKEGSDGITEHVRLDEREYLTSAELESMHGRCSDLLHAKNPFGKKADYKWYAGVAPVWLEKLVNLLNFHEIHLVGTDRMWVVQMEVDGKPAMTPFEVVRAGESGGQPGQN